MGCIPPGEILWLRCHACGSQFPTFVFSGDTDMATDSFRTTTDMVERVLHIFRRSDARQPGEEVALARVEEVKPLPTETFWSYHLRCEKNPPRHFYRCLACGAEEAEAFKSLAPAPKGGKDFSIRIHP